MTNTDLVLAFETFALLAKDLTPRHLQRISIRIPLSTDQRKHFEAVLPYQFDQTNFENGIEPNGDEFLFVPSRGKGSMEAAQFDLPYIGFKLSSLAKVVHESTSMLIDEDAENPSSIFASMLNMLYFDPGAQKALWKNVRPGDGLSGFSKRKTWQMPATF